MWCFKNSVPKLAKMVYEEIKNLVPKLDADGKNANNFFCVVSPAEQKAFCLNEAGWPRNDIDLFINMQNQKVASDILSRLEEIPQKGFPSDENPDLIRMSLMSKYQQTESEVTSWIEGQLEIKEYENMQKQLEADETMSAEERAKTLKEFKENLSNEERDIWLQAKRKQQIDDMLAVEAESKKSKSKSK